MSHSFDPTAILYLTGEIVFVAAVILALFRLRRRFGLGLLFIFVGSNQYLQTVLASSFYIDLGAGVSVSPGSVVLFSSSLFAILLTYLRESIPKTRTLIYGIVLSNLTLTLLAWLTDHQLKVLPTENVLGENGTDRRHGGTGLGLAITRALSERMGFRVEVVSEVGRGSTFRVVMGQVPSR